MIFSLFQSGFRDPRMMAYGMSLPDIPFFDGNMFKQVIMYCTRYLVIDFVNFLEVME